MFTHYFHNGVARPPIIKEAPIDVAVKSDE
jgi:hypothetical protein